MAKAPAKKSGKTAARRRPPKPPGPPAGVLTEQQALFIRYWLEHRNGSRAARQAGYSPHSAADTAHRLLRDPQFAHVQEALRRAKAADEGKWSGLRELTLNHVHLVLGADPIDLYDDEGQLRPLDQMDPEARAVIKELSETEFLGEGGSPSKTRKAKLHSKNEMATLAAKITGLTKDRIELEPVDIRTARRDLDDRLADLVPREGLGGGAGGEGPGGEGEAAPEPDGPRVP